MAASPSPPQTLNNKTVLDAPDEDAVVGVCKDGDIGDGDGDGDPIKVSINYEGDVQNIMLVSMDTVSGVYTAMISSEIFVGQKCKLSSGGVILERDTTFRSIGIVNGAVKLTAVDSDGVDGDDDRVGVGDSGVGDDVVCEKINSPVVDIDGNEKNDDVASGESVSDDSDGDDGDGDNGDEQDDDVASGDIVSDDSDGDGDDGDDDDSYRYDRIIVQLFHLPFIKILTIYHSSKY